MPVYKLGPVRRGTGSPPAKPKTAAIGGVGTELKAMLAWTVLLKSPGKKCQCEARAKEMDDKGLEWCERNRELIIIWLREGAAELGIPFFELPARHALKIAINRVRAREIQPMQANSPK